jgi:UDP-3-O-[3-hydroxymyristoyl] glucosamine N-acyltransferase
MSYSLAELAKHVGGKIIGDQNAQVVSAATLSNAKSGDITFLANQKYASEVAGTQATALVSKNEVETNASIIIADDPYYAFQQIVVLLYGQRQHPPAGISDKATIAPTAKVNSGCYIGDFVSVGDNVEIGENSSIYPGVSIGSDTKIGSGCIIYANVVILEKCTMGDRVIIQPNATIGHDGFGFATHNGVHHKIPHVGSVILHDDVEIGASCAIERGAMDDTVIGKGSKVGDAVTIGHGAKIGAGCLFVPQCGISGSAELGNYVVVGGQVGIVGHIKIGDQVMIAAQAGVINDVPAGKQMLGAPAIDAQQGKRAYSMIQYLPELRRKIKKIEKKLDITDD